jgi:ankyrin repeat protein
MRQRITHQIRAILTLSALLALCTFVAAAPVDPRVADAAERRDAAAVRMLLKTRADVNGRQPDGATALAWAAHWDDRELAAVLLAAGADVNAADDHGVTPLALACANGSAAMASRLLESGANPNAARSTGETPLMTAARTGSADLVRSLIAKGAALDANTTTSKQTALMWAAAESHPDVVRTLVAAGASVAAKSAGGFTALLFAARQGDVASARILLDTGADANTATPDGNSALTIATASGREEVALLLVERGADPNAAGAGFTALHAAVPKDMRRAVAALLAHGADPNVRLRSAPPSLFGPARGAGSEVITEVEAAKPRAVGGGSARPGAERAFGGAGSFAGATPFWLAAKTVNVEIMRMLAEHGADPTLTNVDGTTPLMAAAGVTQVQGPRAKRGDVSQFYSNWGEADSLQAIDYLLGLGADVNAANQAGQTALHGAAYMGGTALVRRLVERGARINAQDAQGQTPYRIAEGHLNVAAQGVTEWPKTAALLKTLGADPTLGVDGRTMLRRYVNTNDAASSPRR